MYVTNVLKKEYKMVSKNIQTAICVVCHDDFIKRIRNKGGRHAPGIRRSDCKICSKKCSRDWCYISSELLSKKRRMEAKRKKADMAIKIAKTAIKAFI